MEYEIREYRFTHPKAVELGQWEIWELDGDEWEHLPEETYVFYDMEDRGSQHGHALDGLDALMTLAKRRGEITWNHRIVNCPSENGGDDYFVIKEVHYDADGKPNGYTDAFMGGDDLEGVQWLINRFQDALAEPAMHEDDFKNV
jgi:hypothetical protein